jgi:hypothetical protein
VQDGDILVLDSLALALSKVAPVLEKRLLRSKKRIRYGFDTPLQSLTSGICGIYFMYFFSAFAGFSFQKDVSCLSHLMLAMASPQTRMIKLKCIIFWCK